MTAKTVVVEAIAALEEYFASLPDPRIERCRRHKLIDILTIAICSMLCGGDGFTDMEEFGQARHEWLKTFLELPHGIPSHDTFGRVFAQLSPVGFAACFERSRECQCRETVGRSGGVGRQAGATLIRSG